jgi:hypothetical protein
VCVATPGAFVAMEARARARRVRWTHGRDENRRRPVWSGEGEDERFGRVIGLIRVNTAVGRLGPDSMARTSRSEVSSLRVRQEAVLS